MRLIRKLFIGLIGLFVVAYAGLWLFPPELFRVGTGYTAKIVCSNVFIAGRDWEEVQRVDVQAPGHPLLRYVSLDVDVSEGSVTAHLFGFLARSVAWARTGYGCSLSPSGERDRGGENFSAPQAPVVEFNWPEAADARLDAVLTDDALLGPGWRAVLVVKDGRIVGERYAEGFAADTPLLGWSMTKTVTSFAVGHAIGQGWIGLDDASLFREWSGGAREGITLSSLLAMESGLTWNEGYGNVSDVTRMLFLDGSFLTTPLAQPAEDGIGETFVYSSGTTNLIARHLIDAAPMGREVFHDVLFAPMGMASARLELDAEGNPGGSSWMYATARDWAKFGQLWLNGGLWGNRQIVPRDYIEYMTVPTFASDGRYGKGHVWLETADKALPQGTFRMSGHDGQFVTVVPSERTVIVRLGLTPSRLGWEPQPLTREVLKALRD